MKFSHATKKQPSCGRQEVESAAAAREAEDFLGTANAAWQEASRSWGIS